MADDNYKVITSTAIAAISTVRLYDETVSTILKKHPEVGALADPIEATSNTVARPSRVHSSTTAPGKAFVFVNDAHTYQGHALAVPVKVIEGTTSGRVVTAYFRDRNYPGDLVWSRADE
jgi:hypothetical protein